METQIEKVLVRDGESEFKHYCSSFERFAATYNEFANLVQTELPDLKIEMDKQWWVDFNNNHAKNRISNMIDAFAETQPHSLREHVINWHWEKLNTLMEKWDKILNEFQRFKHPVTSYYPSQVIDFKITPFDRAGKMSLTEGFKNEIRSSFNVYASGEKTKEALELMNQVCDVYNKISNRITEGKSHPSFQQFNLSGSKPFFIDIDKNGKYIPHANYLNTI